MSQLIESRDIPICLLIEKAPDVPGQWQVYCLNVNVVSYGNSPEHALEMGREAASIVIIDDLNKGSEPTRRRASEEDWNRFNLLQKEAQKIDSSDINNHKIILVHETLYFERRTSKADTSTLPILSQNPVWIPPKEPLIELQLACG